MEPKTYWCVEPKAQFGTILVYNSAPDSFVK
jgi:hypothetical protein